MSDGLTAKIKRIIGGKPNHPKGLYQAKVISVSSQKGGVGKTTTAVNLSCGLAQYFNKKVLLVDMDPQSHIESNLKSELYKKELRRFSTSLLEKDIDLMDLVTPTRIENLYVIPSDKELTQAEIILNTRLGKEHILRRGLATARTHFDYILIDCPPNFGNLTINALVASDYVLIPMDMSILALDGVQSLIETIQNINDFLNPALDILGIVLTRYDRRNQTVNTEIESRLKELALPVFSVRVQTSTDINKSQLLGTSIFNYSPNSLSAKNCLALIEEIMVTSAPSNQIRYANSRFYG